MKHQLIHKHHLIEAVAQQSGDGTWIPVLCVTLNFETAPGIAREEILEVFETREEAEARSIEIAIERIDRGELG